MSAQLSPDALAAIEARVAAAANALGSHGEFVYGDGSGSDGSNGAGRRALTDLQALLAAVRRSRPVATWGRHKQFDVLRVDGKVWASVDCPNGLWRACIDRQPATFYTREVDARAHIEKWAQMDGYEVRSPAQTASGQDDE